MNKLKRWKLTAIDGYGIGVCGVLTLIYALFVLMPALASRGEAAARRGELAGAKAKAGLLALQLSQSNHDVESVRQALAVSPLKLEPIDHLNNRLADLSAFCTSCGLDIQDMTPGATTLGGSYATVRLSLAGTGSYRTCMLFLHRLHGRFLDLTVDSFELSGNPDDASMPLSARFELRWFAKPDTITSAQ